MKSVIDLGIVVAGLSRHPGCPTAWMPDQVRHDNPWCGMTTLLRHDFMIHVPYVHLGTKRG